MSGRILKKMSRPVSRVLSRTIIYLGLPLPADSSHLLRTAGPASCSPAVLLRIEFTASTCLHATGELLPHLSTIPCAEAQEVYFCCTCPRVAPGGCYPLSLPCGARTFLMYRLSPYTRGRSVSSFTPCSIILRLPSYARRSGHRRFLRTYPAFSAYF